MHSCTLSLCACDSVTEMVGGAEGAGLGGSVEEEEELELGWTEESLLPFAWLLLLLALVFLGWWCFLKRRKKREREREGGGARC